MAGFCFKGTSFGLLISVLTNDPLELQEPIGWFIHCCQLVVGKGQEIYDGDDDKDEEAPALDKMLDFCDDLVRFDFWRLFLARPKDLFCLF